jgi:thiol-disulfide isomerase/thioredoxin
MKVLRAVIPLLLLLLVVFLVSTDVATRAPVGADLGSGEFSPTNPPLPAPADIAVTTRDGRSMRLAELKGQPLLVNFWATWCAPCVREMPSLERLAAERGSSLAVLAISVDRRGEAVVGPFIERQAISKLPIYLDSKSELAHAFGVEGIPTTILIDREGREVGRYLGPADWNGAAAHRLLDRLLEKGEQRSAQR